MNYEGKKVLFIVNKHAGTGYQEALEGRMVDACAQYNAECTIEFTKARGHAIELAANARQQGFALVVAVGGDGTLNEVAQGAIQCGLPMGIIPRGSGNGLARHLGVPLQVPAGLQVLFTGKPLAMDTFTVNGKLSLNVSGFGFDGQIANLFGGKTKRGLTGYIRLTLKEYFDFKEFPVTITFDNNKIEREVFILAVANSSQYGNNARIAPQASVCDQQLHITLLKKIPPYRLDFIYALFTGKLRKSLRCEMVTASTLHISTPTVIPFHVDGEPCGADREFIITLQPGALQMMVPNVTNV